MEIFVNREFQTVLAALNFSSLANEARLSARVEGFVVDALTLNLFSREGGYTLSAEVDLTRRVVDLRELAFNVAVSTALLADADSIEHEIASIWLMQNVEKISFMKVNTFLVGAVLFNGISDDFRFGVPLSELGDLQLEDFVHEYDEFTFDESDPYSPSLDDAAPRSLSEAMDFMFRLVPGKSGDLDDDSSDSSA